MKNKIKLGSLLILAFCSYMVNGISQMPQPDPSVKVFEKGNTEEQLNYLIDNSRTFINNKVVKIDWLNTVKKNVLDNEKELTDKINELESLISKGKSKVEDLENSLQENQIQLAKTSQQVEKISFFGSDMSKGTFKLIFWIMLAVLGSATAFFFMKFRSSNSITKEVKEKYEELEVAHEDLRKRKREREQELKRKLQDEINKYS